MNAQNVLTVVIGSLVSGVVAVGVYLIQSTMARLTKHMDERFQRLETSQATTQNEFVAFRLNVSTDYARTADLQNEDRKNSASHGTIHGRIDDIEHRVTVIETVQKHCNSCSGGK